MHKTFSLHERIGAAAHYTERITLLRAAGEPGSPGGSRLPERLARAVISRSSEALGLYPRRAMPRADWRLLPPCACLVCPKAMFSGWIGRKQSRTPLSNPAFATSRDQLRRLCRSDGIRAIACSWSGEPHRDHVAAHDLARAVCGHSVTLYEYLVWGWTLPDLTRQLAGRNLLRIDVRETSVRRKRALACDRTQLSRLISDAVDAFRLRLPSAALKS